MLTYTTVSNPQFANDASTLIKLDVTFDHIGSPVEFLASPTDTEEHGRNLFHSALANEFGTIAAYIAPVVDLAVVARAQRDVLLAQSDYTQLADAPFTTEQKAQWAAYRQDLRDVTTQVDFPTTIVWPTGPV